MPFLGYRSSQEALGRVRQTGLRESLLTTLRNIYKLWQKSGLCFAKQICPRLFHQLVSWGKHNLPFLKGLLNPPIVSRAAWHALSLSKFCFLEPRKSSSSKLSFNPGPKKKVSPPDPSWEIAKIPVCLTPAMKWRFSSEMKDLGVVAQTLNPNGGR